MTKPDYEGVQAAITLYLDGLYHSDTNLLGQVMHPNARYVTATAEPTINMGMGEYLPIVDKRPSPASRGEPRQDRIHGIDFAGPNTAIVRLGCAIAERRFTDFLSLIKEDGQWRIISKVYHYDIVEE
jgi:hypothetical protein